jgi:hypothetical protein
MSSILLGPIGPKAAGEGGARGPPGTPTYDISATAGKQAIAWMLASARILAATGMPAGKGTTSTAKMPATAGSVWKSYKSGRI